MCIRDRYYGGYVTKSPYRITVPSSGRWYVTIDLGGYAGSVKHSVQAVSYTHLDVYKRQGCYGRRFL